MIEENSGNVRLIDPHSANHETNIVNEIHNYEDMFIFAELLANRRGRSVIVKSDSGMRISDDGSDDEISVNLMGVNQNKKSPDFGKFTTNYYDGSVNDGDVYESFGITNIKVKINSSYIPQVEIQFTDVRGLSFFNQKNSKYRILFDFPPPIFTLTLKGYYGKTLTYKLHLVNYKTEFDSNNGNYIINGSFVALTFAPLTDILFRYVVNVGMLDDNIDNLTSNTNTAPKNTFELIMKLENLYSAVNERVKGSNENLEYQDVITTINIIDRIINLIDNFSDNIILSKYNPYMVILQASNNDLNDYSLIRINDTKDYLKLINEYSTTEDIPTNIPDRLLIVFQEYSESLFEYNNVNDLTNLSNRYVKTLNSYRSKILNITRNELTERIVSGDDIIRANEPIVSNYNISKQREIEKNIFYHNIDISDFYIKLIKEKNRLNKKKEELGSEISSKINDMVISELGMKPTIQNVFGIILDDVDKFFRILKKTAMEAEGENGHTSNFDAFLNNQSPDIKVMESNDSDNKIYAFPLFIKQQKLPCNGITEVRSAPIETFGLYELPEITLIQRFIETFTRQGEIIKLSRMREERNSDGSNIWIPISPFDSTFNIDLDRKSPYIDFNNNLLNNELMVKIFKTLVNRYNVMSQNIFRYKFINYGDNSSVNEAYVKLYAEGEASNILLSTTNKKTLELLETNVKLFKSSINEFYGYLRNENIYDNIENPDYIPLGLTNDGDLYIDKYNDNFNGVLINNSNIELKTEASISSPVDEFNDNAKKSLLGRFRDEIFGNQNIDARYKFSMDNIIYIPDIDVLVDEDLYSTPMRDGDIIFNTKYLIIDTVNENNGLDDIERIDDSINSNDNFKFNTLTNNISLINKNENVYRIWRNTFYVDDTFNKIYDIFNEDGLIDLKLLLLVSNFGTTLGPFNVYPSKLNEFFFSIPSIIEVPEFLLLYIGAILSINESSDDYNKFIEYFGNDKRSYLILADFNDFNDFISKTDKETFKSRFNDFKKGEKFSLLLGRFEELLNALSNSSDNNARDANLMDLLNPNKGNNMCRDILHPLMKKNNLIINSQLTFSKETTPSEYISLSEFNDNYGNVSGLFFNTFFKEILDGISEYYDELDEKEKELNKIKEDEDIVTQTYYSFKNINDKWLTGTQTGEMGYPNIPSNTKLKDHFVFVDRAMNPIGDTIIDVEILLSLFDDYNVNVFSVLSQILSINGFEFFPLQNFMSYKGDDWKESFKISTNTKINTNNFFVCMYVGGASSHPYNGNNFHDDGIVDISNPGVPDFSTTDDCGEGEIDGQTINNKFPYRDVRAFKVRFGEQNQSMFTDYKINSKDHPETNESIKILSRLAGDNNKQSPIPKGQNLYNLYENRSYSATINGLGNMMIQPTQYFQLENVPLFNGAYVVLSVEHDITPNKMTTSFSGTKILKYPIPRVLNSVAFTEFKDFNDISAGQIVKQAEVISNIPEVRYNSMYLSKIINTDTE